MLRIEAGGIAVREAIALKGEITTTAIAVIGIVGSRLNAPERSNVLASWPGSVSESARESEAGMYMYIPERIHTAAPTVITAAMVATAAAATAVTATKLNGAFGTDLIEGRKMPAIAGPLIQITQAIIDRVMVRTARDSAEGTNRAIANTAAVAGKTAASES